MKNEENALVDSKGAMFKSSGISRDKGASHIMYNSSSRLFWIKKQASSGKWRQHHAQIYAKAP